jgi:hypothetical protein
VEGDGDGDGSSDLQQEGEGDTGKPEARHASSHRDLGHQADQGKMDEVERVGGVAESLDPGVSTDGKVLFLRGEKSEEQAGST